MNIVICVCVRAVCACVYTFVTVCSRSYCCGYVSVHACVDRPMHIIDHEYMCVCIKQTKQSPLSKLQ